MNRRRRLEGLNAKALLKQSVNEAPSSMPVDLPKVPGFEVRSILGRGSTGMVLEAWQEEPARAVALKVLTPEHMADVLLRERLEREAQVMARLQHPHIVAVHDFLIAEDGSAAIVMELVSGPTLRHVLRDHGKLPPVQAVTWGRQMASALQCVHEAGLTHRDLKPENVLVDGDGHLRVTDFGIAFSDDGAPRLTLTGTRLGTDGYMAPEQANALQVDARSDVYSLGVVLFELLQGALPSGRIDRVTSSCAGVPESLCAVLMRSLQPSPAERLASMREFEQALQEVEAELSQEGTEGWLERFRQTVEGFLGRARAPKG